MRELRHAIERAAGLCGLDESLIHAKDFDFLRQQSFDFASGDWITGDLNLKQMEKMMILRALKTVKGNRADAAKALGIARSTLFEMMKRHQIAGPRTKDYWLESLKIS